MIRLTTTEKHMTDTYKRITSSADRILSVTLSALYASTAFLIIYYLDFKLTDNPKSFHFFWSLLANKQPIVDIFKAFFMIAITLSLLNLFALYESKKSGKIETVQIDNRDMLIKTLAPYTYTLLAVALLPIVVIGVVYSPLLTTPTDYPLLNAMLFISAYFITLRSIMLFVDWFLSEPKKEQEDA